MDDNDELLMEEEAARLLRLTARTLQGWRVAGIGPSYVKMGRAVRYRRSVLLAWLAARSVSTKARKAQAYPDRGGAHA